MPSDFHGINAEFLKMRLTDGCVSIVVSQKLALLLCPFSTYVAHTREKSDRRAYNK